MATEDRTNGGEKFYYNARGERMVLRAMPDLLAVRFKPGRAQLAGEALALLRTRTAPALAVRNYGIQVVETDVRDRALSVFNREADVEFATPVFRRAEARGEPVLVSKRFVAQFRRSVTREDIEAFNSEHHVHIVEDLDYLANGYLLEGDDRAPDAVDLARLYFESRLTVFAEPDLIQRKAIKAVAERTAEKAARAERAATYLSRQWHLSLTRVTDAWEKFGNGDRKILIAILDDGVDVAHPEFRGKVVKEYDFATHQTDGRPKRASDKHGTACAGVATAGGAKASGAAPGCGLMAIRTPDYLGSADEAKMFTWAADNGADIISCSWGPADGTNSVDPLPEALRAAIHECVRPGGRGRDGRGIPIFWAAGNGDESVDNDGYAANPDVIAIAASTDAEEKAWYSDYGKAVFVCAPSNGGDQGIFTADRRGGEGYNRGAGALSDADYCDDFGGTSSATPLAAGIAALMLSAKPELTPDDVRRCLRQSAVKIGPSSGYKSDGRSREFGFGRVDAYEAVRAARSGPSTPSAGPQVPKITVRNGSPGGQPPTFEVDPRPNSYYAVEVATDPLLFTAGRKDDRTTNNFYRSWSQGKLLRVAREYTLPSSVWNRLDGGPKLFYRALTSSKRDDWVDVKASTPLKKIKEAPFIDLEGGSQ